MKHIITLLILISLGFASFAEQGEFKQGKITGKIIEGDNKPLEFVTVTLLKATDSSIVKAGFTTNEGNFEFEFLPIGEYVISASMLGYKKELSKRIQITEQNSIVNIGVLTLSRESTTLKTVNIVAQKPLIEQKIDRLVMNVEGSIVATGGTALEVLEKAPGVAIDKDDKISLKGKQGVIIMVDGKPSALSQADLANMLKTMSSNSIESIEIITNPSAKYDASGNSGIINIKLKKDQNMGLNGSASLGTGYGLRAKYNGGLNLNYRNGKVSLFGNANYFNNQSRNGMDLTRVIQFNNQITNFKQENDRDQHNVNYSYKTGADYFLNKKNTFGFIVSGYETNIDILSNGFTQIRGMGPNVDSSLVLGTQSDMSFKSNTFNLNYRKTFDVQGREFSIDADYSTFESRGVDDLSTRYFDGSGSESHTPLLLRNTKPSAIDIYSIKTDYVHTIGKTVKIETGAKFSFVTTDNNVKFEQLVNNNWQIDNGRTNQFVYKENVNAAYVSASKEFKKFSVQAGLRMEHTISEGNSITLNKIVKNNYVEFFPSIFIRQPISENHQLGYSYSRRIGRPSYQDLNPFTNFLDPYTFQQGNPFLKPQFTNSFEISHTYKQRYITTVGVSRTTDAFQTITRQDDETKITLATEENLNTFTNYNIGVVAPFVIAKWWSMNNHVNVYYNQFQSRLGNADLDNSQLSYKINTSNSFTFAPGFTGEISGQYQSAMVHGIMNAKAMYAISTGIQTTFWDRKATLRLNVNDIFNTRKFNGTIKFDNMDLVLKNRWESRQARLTFSYRFGNNKVQQGGRRTTGSQEEQNRIKTGN